MPPRPARVAAVASPCARAGPSLPATPTLEPRAGPTGGEGLALPAGRASLILPVTAGRKNKGRGHQAHKG